MSLRRAAGAGLALLAAVGCSSGPSADRDATERMFLETCAPGGADVEVEVCQCAFDRLTDGLTDEEVEELDRSVRGADELPEEVVAASVECAAEPLTPPTSTVPTVPTDDDEGDDE